MIYVQCVLYPMSDRRPRISPICAGHGQHPPSPRRGAMRKPCRCRTPRGRRCRPSSTRRSAQSHASTRGCARAARARRTRSRRSRTSSAARGARRRTPASRARARPRSCTAAARGTLWRVGERGRGRRTEGARTAEGGAEALADGPERALDGAERGLAVAERELRKVRGLCLRVAGGGGRLRLRVAGDGRRLGLGGLRGLLRRREAGAAGARGAEGAGCAQGGARHGRGRRGRRRCFGVDEDRRRARVAPWRPGVARRARDCILSPAVSAGRGSRPAARPYLGPCVRDNALTHALHSNPPCTSRPRTQ
jgi:hypothetical protein